MRIEMGATPSPRKIAIEKNREFIIDTIDAPLFGAHRITPPDIEHVPDLLRTKIAELPFEEVGPTFDSIGTVAERRRGEREIEKPRTTEEAMIFYVKKLMNPDDMLPPEDKAFIEKVQESRRDYGYYEDLGTLTEARKINTDYTRMLQHDWEILEKEKKLLPDKTPAEIAQKWTNLEQALQKQREGGLTINSQSKIKRLILELSHTPLATRVQALWDEAFTAEQKLTVQSVLGDYQNSVALTSMTGRFTAYDQDRMYKNEVYRATMDELRTMYGQSPETGWCTKIVGVTDFYDNMEKALGVNIGELPPTLQTALGEPDYEATPRYAPMSLDYKRANKLRGLVAEISLTILMKNIAEEQPER